MSEKDKPWKIDRPICDEYGEACLVNLYKQVKDGFTTMSLDQKGHPAGVMACKLD